MVGLLVFQGRLGTSRLTRQRDQLAIVVVAQALGAGVGVEAFAGGT